MDTMELIAKTVKLYIIRDIFLIKFFLTIEIQLKKLITNAQQWELIQIQFIAGIISIAIWVVID